MSSILIKNAIIATMNNKLLQGDLFIEDGKITEIARSIEKEADKVIQAAGKVVMPGFVNAHTHVGMGAFRGYSDDTNYEDWYKRTIAPIESKMTPEDVYNSSMLSFIEMIKSGTTTFNDVYFFEEETAKAAEEIGIRGIVSRRINGDGEEAIKKVKEAEDLYEAWNGKADGRINVYVGLGSASECSPATIKKAVDLALKLNVPLNVSFLENKDEINQVKEKYNSLVVDYLKQNNVFKTKTILAHGAWADEYDLAELCFHDTSIVSNPISNAKIGSGIADIKFLVEGGLNCALGSDGTASSCTLDMFEELKHAAYSQKLLYKSASAISAKKVLEMATIKGAKALGLQKDIGTIEVGKKADVIIVNLNKPHLTPIHNMYSTLAYSANGADVDTVIIDGNIIMEDRKLLTVNEDEVLKNVREMAKRLFK